MGSCSKLLITTSNIIGSDICLTSFQHQALSVICLHAKQYIQWEFYPHFFSFKFKTLSSVTNVDHYQICWSSTDISKHIFHELMALLNMGH